MTILLGHTNGIASLGNQRVGAWTAFKRKQTTMNCFKTVTVLCACSALLFLGSHCGLAQDSGFYVKGDAGGNWTEDVELREFFGARLPGDAQLKLNPGFRFGLGGGYWFADWFALEGEIGVYENGVDTVSGASEVHNGYFGNVPFLVNAKLQLPTRSRFSPYLGAGVGFSETFFSFDDLTIGNVSLHGSDVGIVFAWQAFAGLRYALDRRLSLCVEYRFFAADPSSFDAEDATGTTSSHLSFGRTETQSVSIAVNFKF